MCQCQMLLYLNFILTLRMMQMFPSVGTGVKSVFGTNLRLVGVLRGGGILKTRRAVGKKQPVSPGAAYGLHQL